MNYRYSSMFFGVTIALTGCSGDPGGQTEVNSTSTASNHADEAPLVMANSDSFKPLAVRGNFKKANGTTEAAFRASLTRVAEVYGVDASELRFSGAERDEVGMTHARYAQEIDGIAVVNSDLRLHTNKSGDVFLVTGAVARSAALARTPAIEAADAEFFAADARPGVSLAAATPADLVYVVTADHAGAHLAWRVTMVGMDRDLPVRDDVFVDAQTGDIVKSLPRIHSARNRKSYTANNGSSTPGTLKRSEGEPANADIDINAAYDNTGFVYDFYFGRYGRDSFDNAGATLVTSVHYSRNYCNAYWDGSQMVYGDGDGTYCGPLARGLDVTAHELTHAVTERTAGLEYYGESGGLNEAMSDIFGNVVEEFRDGAISQNTWMVGEEIWTPATPGDALRYMDDPAKDGDSLDYYPNYGGQDVHYSSGIANLAFQRLTVGGGHPHGTTTASVQKPVGIEKSAAIFYRALSTYLTATSNFEAARNATAQAAADLYGADEVAAVHQAWDVLGVPGGPNAPPEPEPQALQNGAAVAVAGAAKSKTMFKIDVPAGATINVQTSGGSGDADLFIAFGRKPSSADFDSKSDGNSTNEHVSGTAQSAGTFYVLLYGYSVYSGTSIVATY